ncbi:hypothetical protein [Peribacillus aracenensis]|uniref:hypothetical protein n=1 Tax=Peribacillus aracenensis TaxID=2976708 RepID=UPI0021A745AA|nr:hypothetical protein [Peribacillus sp. BBB004]
MKKSNHLNPSLSPCKKPFTESPKRKIRSDKLHDIKIPISEPLDALLRRESRRYWDGSKTSLGTEILVFGLEQMFVYPDVTYQDEPFTVHCKVNHEIFQKIGNHASTWKCSVRQAAHRIFMEALKKKQMGGITDGEI